SVMVGLVASAVGIASVAAEPAKDATAARAEVQKMFGFVPGFIKVIPDPALPGAWEEMKTLQMNPATALSGKQKELIGLGVAAQIPCQYCIEAHTEFAKLNGACEEELGQAVAMAGITRNLSTIVNGIQMDEGKFRGEISRIVEGAKKAQASHAPAPKGIALVDGQSALKDIAQTLGFAPEFLKRIPDVARAAAWKTMKDVQLNPETEMSGKDKELVGLA